MQDLFHGQPAQALHDAPLGLAAVRSGVQAGTQVVHGLHGLHRIGAAQAVQGDLAHGGPAGVVGERLTLFRGPVEMNARGGVVGLGRKAHPPGIGGGHQALPGQGGGLAIVVYLLLADLHLLRPVLAQLAGRGLP